ncbi:MAG TPA: NAD(P)-dependent oxidoreductase [Polyangiaceae bacterium]|nr:NAD(P)-dependent oxidoreductase [Polyangiaceae bacterium]
MTPWFPVALKLAGRRCVVVGEGEEAEARTKALEAAGASVVRSENFHDALLEGAWLAVLTTRDRALAAEMDRACESRRLFFVAVDEPSVGSFSHLALARAGLVTAAIGTNGEAPALARRLRELLEALFERAKLADFAAAHAALRRVTPSAERREVLAEDVREVRLEGELVVPPRARR